MNAPMALTSEGKTVGTLNLHVAYMNNNEYEMRQNNKINKSAVKVPTNLGI